MNTESITMEVPTLMNLHCTMDVVTSYAPPMMFEGDFTSDEEKRVCGRITKLADRVYNMTANGIIREQYRQIVVFYQVGMHSLASQDFVEAFGRMIGLLEGRHAVIKQKTQHEPLLNTKMTTIVPEPIFSHVFERLIFLLWREGGNVPCDPRPLKKAFFAAYKSAKQEAKSWK